MEKKQRRIDKWSSVGSKVEQFQHRTSVFSKFLISYYIVLKSSLLKSNRIPDQYETIQSFIDNL